MCTLEKRGNIFFLTLTGAGAGDGDGDGDPHHINPTIISALRSALSQAKSQTTPGSALITLADGKFFSNGFDLGWVRSAGSPSAAAERLHHLVDLFKPLVADLVSLPMPTIAAVTGHAAAAGLILAISHDYVLMRRDRGFMYMSELDIGVSLPGNFAPIVRAKVGSPAGRRDVLLRASKMTAEEAVAVGLADSAHDSAGSTVEAAVRLAEELGKRKWNGEVYAEIRKDLYPEICGIVGLVPKAIVSKL